MTRSDEDLLGEDPKPQPKPKPTSRQSKRRTDGGSVKADAADTMRAIQALHRPVSITFLADAFAMDRSTVTRRLASLPPVGQHRGNTPLYDFRQAASYLVKPQVDMEQILKSLSADALPPSLQKDVWDARLKAQKWMVQAGQLWATDDVLEVLGEAFQRLKTTTQLWIDQIGDNHALPIAARKELTVLVDTLQADLHKSLVEMPQERATLSQAAMLDEVTDE